jgi:hypothetical protein
MAYAVNGPGAGSYACAVCSACLRLAPHWRVNVVQNLVTAARFGLCGVGSYEYRLRCIRRHGFFDGSRMRCHSTRISEGGPPVA